MIPRKERQVHQAIEQMIERRAFQSACLLVAREGQLLIHRAYGRGLLETVYDLASLTKPLAATAAAMLLTAEGMLCPQEVVATWLPLLKQSPKNKIRLWHLLAHCSGYPAWLPFFQQVMHLPRTRQRSAIRRRAASTPLSAAPGSATIYSDLGFILLDWIIQRSTGRRLDRLLTQRLYGPLGLTRTRFVDLAHAGRSPLPERWSVAPTERCSWRKQRLCGQVHDDNCWAMGGISGHAGLFSSVLDVHLIAREIVAAYAGGRSLFDHHVVRDYLRWSSGPHSTRVLGWDTPAKSGSSAGSHFGASTVGHLGFTGTSIWIDLQKALWVVLLTNRVYYGREPNPMIAFRPRIHDLILSAIQS